MVGFYPSEFLFTKRTKNIKSIGTPFRRMAELYFYVILIFFKYERYPSILLMIFNPS